MNKLIDIPGLGQLCSVKPGEWSLSPEDETVLLNVEHGGQTVVTSEKLYGAYALTVRIRFERETWEWVVEQELTRVDRSTPGEEAEELYWKERARFGGQPDDDECIDRNQ